MSPLLSFTVFKDKILSGEKRQTIRKVRKYPIKEGDRLYLYWHCRQKDCKKLGEAICTEAFTKPWGMLRESEDLAARDGFKSKAEMREWFSKHHKTPDKTDLFQVIRWQLLETSAK